MIARVFPFFLLACVLFLLCPLTSFALPAQIEADRYLLAAKQKIDDQNYSAAKRYFEKIIALEDSISIPDKFYYHYGRVLNKTGDYDKAYQQLEVYLNRTGQLGTFYKEALNQLTVAEEKAQQKIEKEKKHKAEMIAKRVGEMVYVPGGCLQMGDVFDEGMPHSKPVHKVCVDSFNIGKYEVTQWQWQEVMGSNPSSYKGDNSPVERVSWNDVQEFISKINGQTNSNYRLPTEAEWEFAARGGMKSKGYKYSGSNSINEVAWYAGNSGKKTNPVGGKRANELGLYDMTGNVWEWCRDWYDSKYYEKSPERNPAGPVSGKYLVYRGGCCANSPGGLGLQDRRKSSPNQRSDLLGFRLVLPIKY